MPEKFSGEQFLNEKYSDLPGSKPVERAVERKMGKGGKGPKDKEERTETYLNRIEEIISSGTKINDERGWEMLKNKILKEFTIPRPVEGKTEEEMSDEDRERQDVVVKIAHGLYESEKKLAIEQGRGADVERLEQEVEQKGGIIKRYEGLVGEKHEIQQRTLSGWLDYLKQNDAQYPNWFCYYVVRSLQKMGTIDKERGEYSKRTSHTVAPFPELNSEALGFVYRMLTEGPSEDEFTEDEKKKETLKKLIDKKDFAKLYAFAQIETANEANLESNVKDGEWRPYRKGSDHHILEKDLRGKGTGWCTAEGSAYGHLQGGDFYVYYTKGDDGNYSQPRVAIRMEGEQVVEVRGIGHRQEIEPIPELLEIAQKQYHDLPGGEKFDKKSDDMKKVTELVKKQELGEPFNEKDLEFLYEINTPIEGFGYDKDPRVEEILGKRDKRQDIAKVFNCTKEEVGFTQEDYKKSDQLKYYKGDLDLRNIKDAKDLKPLPETFNGDLGLNGLTSAEHLTLPETFNGDLGLNGLTSAEHLTLPEIFNGYLRLEGLTSAEHLTLPETFNGYLWLEGLTSAEHLTLPKTFNGDLGLNGLTSAEHLNFHKTMKAIIYLRKLTDQELDKLEKRYPKADYPDLEFENEKY